MYPVTDLAAAPYSGICLLQGRYSSFPGRVVYGTGFLVSASCIATAGHVLWSDLEGAMRKPDYPDVLDVFLGDGFYDGGANLSWRLSCPTAAVEAHPGFRAGDATLDLGRIRLPHQMSTALRLSDFPGPLAVGGDVLVSGFPVSGDPFGEYEARGALASLAQPVFQHQVETGEGQSGAPIRVADADGLTAIGVHLGEAGDAAGQLRRALAITPAVRAWLNS